METSDDDPALRAPVFLALAWSRGIAAIIGPVIAGSLYDRSHDKEVRLYGGHGFVNVTIFVGDDFCDGISWSGNGMVEKSSLRSILL